MKIVICLNCGISFQTKNSSRRRSCSDLCREQRKHTQYLGRSSDPAWREKKIEYGREWRLENKDIANEKRRIVNAIKGAVDPVWLESKRVKARERRRIQFAKNPACRERHNKRKRELASGRYATDLAWRELRKENVRDSHRKKAAIVAAVKGLGINIGDLKC